MYVADTRSAWPSNLLAMSGRQMCSYVRAPDSRVISCCDADEVRVWQPSDYLPDPFSAETLLNRGSGGR